MNIADYLSELLFSNNEVSVPGLGCFSLVRKSAWYNAKEAKFYPPYHQVIFVNQPKDDETFINYLSRKNNLTPEACISLIESFIADLNEQVGLRNKVFGGLGWFYEQDGHLAFKTNDKIATDPYFFGYSSIIINKLSEPDHKAGSPPTLPKTEPQSPIIENKINENFIKKEPVKKKPVNIWISILLIIIIMALATFGLYQYDPSAFNSLKAAYQNIIENNKKAIVPVLKNGAHHGALKKKGTQAGIVAAKMEIDTTADTTTTSRWEIIVVSFKTLEKAQEQVAHYKRMGLNARIVEDTAGSFKRISVGTFKTLKEANSAKLKLAKANKISNDAQSISIEDITAPFKRISVGTYKTKGEAEQKMRELVNSHKINKDSYPIEIKPKK